VALSSLSAHQYGTYSAVRAAKEEGNTRAIRHFFSQYTEFDRLCMLRVQLVDESVCA
jgi:hypothetical protein